MNDNQQPYPQRTPSPRARGKYTVREPFRIVETDTYTCIAIRSFRDMLNDGIDPYEDIYLPVGLIDGQSTGGRVFSYQKESIQGINIISLESDSGKIVHVPDNYILSFPDSSLIRYNRMVLSGDLGFLPSNIDLTAVKQAVANTITNYLGVKKPIINHSEAPSRNEPTYEQHLEFETIRKAAVKLVDTPEVQTQTLLNRIAELEKTNQELTQICIDNNYIG